MLTSPETWTQGDIAALLRTRDPDEIEEIRAAAEQVLLRECGDAVHLRGLVESSNVCKCDCDYCGIRKSRRDVERYTLEEDDILACAHLIAELGYGSMVIQSGERSDQKFIDLTARAVARIKRETRSGDLPDGLGITLCVGQQSRDVYQRLFDAGAHRYLLRIETTNPDLFAKIHPKEQTLASRMECLEVLREVGFQVGTGVMIGLPGQTVEDLAADVMFYKTQDVDMFGMGPYIPAPDTPLVAQDCPPAEDRLRLGFLMIAATRLLCRDVNIASTTALQTLHPHARETGLRFGANVLMPQTTPPERRRSYQLYAGKSNLDENAATFRTELEARLKAIGRRIEVNKWGDSRHAVRRMQ